MFVYLISNLHIENMTHTDIFFDRLALHGGVRPEHAGPRICIHFLAIDRLAIPEALII